MRLTSIAKSTEVTALKWSVGQEVNLQGKADPFITDSPVLFYAIHLPLESPVLLFQSAATKPPSPVYLMHSWSHQPCPHSPEPPTFLISPSFTLKPLKPPCIPIVHAPPTM